MGEAAGERGQECQREEGGAAGKASSKRREEPQLLRAHGVQMAFADSLRAIFGLWDVGSVRIATMAISWTPHVFALASRRATLGILRPGFSRGGHKPQDCATRPS